MDTALPTSLMMYWNKPNKELVFIKGDFANPNLKIEDFNSHLHSEETPQYATMEEFLAALKPETAQAIIDAEEGKNLISYDSIESFFDSLDD